MKKKEYFYYVLVITKNGPIFVTDEPKEYHNYVKWNKYDKPMRMSEEYALDMVTGLTANMFLAYVIKSKWEINTQPYMYKYGQLEWKKEEKEAN